MIRLARVGKTKKAYFRLIVSEKTKDTHGDYLEALGNIDPHTNPRKITLKVDRIKYWLEHGAKASPSVYNMLVEMGVIAGEKTRVWKPKKRAVEESKEPAKVEAKPEVVKEEAVPAEVAAS